MAVMPLLLPLVLVAVVTVPTSSTASAWKWRPEDEHPCTVRQRFTRREFLQKFGPRGLPPLYPEPIVILGSNDDDGDADPNREFRRLTERDNLLEWFGPDFDVTLSSSNARSEHRRTVPLRQYVDEITAAGETTPDQRANETWYLFGETYSDAWRDLLYPHYRLPPCHTCNRNHYAVALSFGIGNRGSGVQWHQHGPGFSEALHGRKHWVLYPPGAATAADFPKDQSSRQWMEDVYYPMKMMMKEDVVDGGGDDDDDGESSLPVECTLDPGDIIYFPDGWWHATINLDPYTAFISTFTTEHNVEDEGDDEDDDGDLLRPLRQSDEL